MENFYYGHMFGWGMAGGLMMAFWVLVVLFVVWLVREVASKDTGHSSKALEILKERYAKGEIGKEEFEAKQKDIIS